MWCWIIAVYALSCQNVAFGQAVDVVIVGAGAAGFSAALGVVRDKPTAKVLLVESDRVYGGTSYRSGGRLWVPNTLELREAALADPKLRYTRVSDLHYMAAVAYPNEHQSDLNHMGMRLNEYTLLETYYGSGAEIIDYYNRTGILPTQIERYRLYPNGCTPPIDPQSIECRDTLNLTGTMAPDYLAFPGQTHRVGRTILPLPFEGVPGRLGVTGPIPGFEDNYSASLRGPDLIEWMRQACLLRGVTILTDVDVRDILFNNSRVSGVSAVLRVRNSLPNVDLEIPLTIQTKAVIWASGGFSKSASKVNTYFSQKPFSGGGCAVMTAQGRLIDVATSRGWPLALTDSAWLIENVWEQYRLDPTSDIIAGNYLLFQAYWLNGDSMVVVNSQGSRVINEKINYNTRTKIHWSSPSNKFLFAIADQHAVDYFTGASGQLTIALQTLIGPAQNLSQLAQLIRTRLDQYPETQSVTLDTNFVDHLSGQVARFNQYATTGNDLEFGRGQTLIDIWWHTFCLTFSTPGLTNCIDANVNATGHRYPNPTMRPLVGPYYAVILSSGLQDTKGGPRINSRGQILGANGPVPGVYGAGNAVASVAGYGYWGAGGTLGPAVVFGHIAGRSAAADLDQV